MKTVYWMAAAAVACVLSADAAFDARPFSIAFYTSRDGAIDVAGIRLNLPRGHNDSVTGLDLGVIGQTTYLYGIQANALANVVKDRAGAIQASLYNDVDGLLTGIQIGGWNNARCCEGLQVGILNLSDEFYGGQIGFINRANLLSGFQIGVINVIRGSRIPFIPIVNIWF